EAAAAQLEVARRDVDDHLVADLDRPGRPLVGDRGTALVADLDRDLSHGARALDRRHDAAPPREARHAEAATRPRATSSSVSSASPATDPAGAGCRAS